MTLIAAAETFVLDALVAPGAAEAEAAFTRVLEAARAEPDTSPFAALASGFQLDSAESALILLCAAQAMAPAAARALEAAAGAGGVPVWCARALIPELAPDHLSVQSTLRRFLLIEAEGGDATARLKLPAALQDWLSGLPAADPVCLAHATRLPAPNALADTALVEALASLLRQRPDGLTPIVQAQGQEPAALSAAAAALGLAFWSLRAVELPEDAVGRDRLARAWSRDAALNGAVLLIDAEDAAPARALGFASRIVGHVMVAGLSGPAPSARPVRLLAAEPPDRRTRWRQALGDLRADQLGAGLDRVARQFKLDGQTIDALAAHCGPALDAAPDSDVAAALLWHAAARAEPARGLPGMTLVEPRQGWEDIVLPPSIEATLRRLEAHVRHAGHVFDAWGFSAKQGGRGRGVAALFAGPSGAGKTMAAEVLAHSLDLRMLVIDLSQIISKFVGETSKNIAAAFAFAERSGAVMVWNEGDAIWGSRGAVGHAVDRHINAEVGDLLQRIEAFEGFTIVTTNLRHAIDPAFLRRFRFVVDFPLPSDAERLRIWRQAFPAEAPLDDIDFRVLARQPLTGAAIRNIALASAFQAVQHGGRIDRAAIAAEVGEELRKSNQIAPVIDWGTPQ